MSSLTLNAEYDRREVHDIFAPQASFTEGSGTWGNHGVVPIPDRPGDWVFFVTFGQSVGSHAFKEGVTKDGVLTWQSQPSQDLTDRRIRQWITHDELKHSIYLFLRTKKGAKYAYLGRLKYLAHDETRSNPVYFNWQILDWDDNQSKIYDLGLELISPTRDELAISELSSSLTETDPPVGAKSTVQKTRSFRARHADFSIRDARNKELGLAGEKAVVEFERYKLLQLGLYDKSLEVRHVALEEGDGAGFDVLSFDADGKEIFIEVKTTRGHEETDFFLTANEYEFFRLHPESYALYRLWNFDKTTSVGKFFVLKADQMTELVLEPVTYRVRR